MLLKNFIFIIFLVPLQLFGQQSALVLHIYPSDAIVHVDGQKQSGEDTLALYDGLHVIEIWKSGYSYERDSVELNSGQSITFKKTLTRSDAYLSHRKALYKYQLAMTTMRYGALAAYAGVVSTQIITLSRSSKATDEAYASALELVQLQEASVLVDEIKAAETLYAIEQALYEIQRASFERRQNTLLTSGIIGGLALLALEYLSFRLEKPLFKEVERLSLQSMPGTPNLTLGIALNR